MTDIEKIKAEIEWRIDSLGEQRDVNLEELLDFINTLEQEPTPKIKGWVARNPKNNILFSEQKPQ